MRTGLIFTSFFFPRRIVFRLLGFPLAALRLGTLHFYPCTGYELELTIRDYFLSRGNPLRNYCQVTYCSRNHYRPGFDCEVLLYYKDILALLPCLRRRRWHDHGVPLCRER